VPSGDLSKRAVRLKQLDRIALKYYRTSRSQLQSERDKMLFGFEHFIGIALITA
jgi:hypothetical protein